jgi:hypothetical protein
MTDRAVARRTDPGTSWAAANSLDPTVLRSSQRAVLTILQDIGPMTDAELCARMAPAMSPSGARSRRSELVAKGLVYDTGKRERLHSGRWAIVWAARWLQVQAKVWE